MSLKKRNSLECFRAFATSLPKVSGVLAVDSSITVGVAFVLLHKPFVAYAKMITDQYSHILDDSRKENAKLLEKAFYQKKEDQPDGNNDKETDSDSDSVPSPKISRERIEGLLQNEKIIALLEKLADASGIDD